MRSMCESASFFNLRGVCPAPNCLSKALVPRRLRVACHSRAAGPALTGPCIVTFRSKTRVSVTVPPESVSRRVGVQQYMAQAVDRFPNVPLPLGKLSKLDAGRLELAMPRIQLLDVWVKPRVLATVDCHSDRVEVRCVTKDCILTGSHHVQQLKLDECFTLDSNVTFTWDKDHTAKQGPAIHTDTSILVSVDVPAPFSYIPKPVLQTTVDAALAAVLPIIRNGFVSNMAKDYVNWAKSQPVGRLNAAGAGGVAATAAATAAEEEEADARVAEVMLEKSSM